MPLNTQWRTSSHHFLHGMVGFDPSVCFQCWDIAWIYSWCEPTNGSLLALQHSCLENPMDRGVWWAAVHGVTKSRTRLSHFTFTFHFPALEKEMATHPSVLAWRIPGTVEPSGLPSVGSHRVRHDWSDLAAAAAAKTAWIQWKLECNILKTQRNTKKNTLRADSPFTLVDFFCHYQETILKKRLTRSSSHRTPRFIMACLVMQLHTHRTISSPHFPHQKVVWLKCVFSVLRDCKETWWVWTWHLGSTSQNCSHPVKARMCHSQIHLRKAFRVWINTFTTINFCC